jgi:ATP-dependent DNA helicase RecG
LEKWPQIDFSDDREGCLFTATIRRVIPADSVKSSVKSAVKTPARILELLSVNRDMTLADLAKALGLSTRGVEKQVANLQTQGRIRRVGGRKVGHWEVDGEVK